MKPLTSREATRLARIVRFFEKNSRFPTCAEICTLVGLASTNSAAGVLLRLGKKGYLLYTPGGRTGQWTIARLPDGTPVVARLVACGPKPDAEEERAAS